MSTDATTPSTVTTTGTTPVTDASVANGSVDKGKGKLAPTDVPMEEEEEDDDEEEEEEEEEEDEMEEDHSQDLAELDPSLILPRRTRGVKIDYASEEALRKAGLKPEAPGADEDEAEDSFVARDDEMQAD
ncbi:hypothetical protein EW146_g5437 [Bondarzewia mesenterica]|uniref:Histone chaperone domain-containing protein n=1 Tax=Bondarzewia mesenterica TaxID=1095465 RepID=A0A4S4LRJ8_9AGAM|nr:hypothetical protein EW146_g5437 [Bondarzewia mesenterica]